MTRRPSLQAALAKAESLDSDGPDYITVRELKAELRALVKDAENAVTA